MLDLGPDSAMDKGISTIRPPGVEDDHLPVERGSNGRCLAAVAGGSTPTLAALVNGEGGDYERGDRVGPPPAGECVKEQTDEQCNRGVRADLVLTGFADGRGRIQ